MFKKNIAFLDKVNGEAVCLSDSNYQNVLAVVSKAENAMSVANTVTKQILAKARGKSPDKRLSIATADSDAQMRRSQALGEVASSITMLNHLARDIYPKFSPERGFYSDSVLGAREHALFLRILDLQVFGLYWSIFTEYGKRQFLGEQSPISVTFFGREFSLDEVVKTAPKMVMRYTNDRFLYMKAGSPLICLYTKCVRQGNKVVLCFFDNPRDVILDYALKILDGKVVVDDGRFYTCVSDSETCERLSFPIRISNADLGNRMLSSIIERLVVELYQGDREAFKDDVFLQVAKIVEFEREMRAMGGGFPLDMFQETYFSPFYRQDVLDGNSTFTFPDMEFFSQFFERNLTPLRRKQLFLAFLFVPLYKFEDNQKICFEPKYFVRLVQFILMNVVSDGRGGWAIDWERLFSQFSQVRTVIEKAESLDMLQNNDLTRMMMEALGVDNERSIGIHIYRNLINVGFLDLEDEFRAFWGEKVKGNINSYFGIVGDIEPDIKAYEDYFISLGLMAKDGDEVYLTLEGELLVSGVSKADREAISKQLEEESQIDDLKINEVLKESRPGVLKLQLDDKGRIKIGRGLNNVYFDFGEGYSNREIVLIKVNDRFLIYSQRDKRIILPWQDIKILTDTGYKRAPRPEIRDEETVLGFVFPYQRDTVTENFYQLIKIIQSSCAKYPQYQKQPSGLSFESYDGDEFEIEGSLIRVPKTLLNQELDEQAKNKLAVLLARKLEPFIGDIWTLVVVDILEKNSLMGELFDFIDEIKGIELEDKRVADTLKGEITRIKLGKAIEKAFPVMSETQARKLKSLLYTQLNSPPGSTVYYSTVGACESVVTEDAYNARVGKKVAVAKVYKSQLYFNYDGELCINKNGDSGEVVYVIYRDTKIIILNEEGEDVSEDVKYKHVYQKLSEEGLMYVLDIFEDFNLVVKHLELFTILNRGLKKLISKQDGIKEWLLSFGHDFTEEYFESIQETILGKCLRLIDVNILQNNPKLILDVIEKFFLFFMGPIMAEADKNGKKLNPIVFSAYIESILEAVFIKFNKGEFKTAEDVENWLDNIWSDFNHNRMPGQKRFKRDTGRVWRFPNEGLEEKICEFFAYFLKEETVELEIGEDDGVRAKVEDSSRVVLSSKARRGAKWLKAGDQYRVDEMFLEAFERLYSEIERKEADPSKEEFRRPARRELRLLAEILMKLSTRRDYIAFVPVEVWGGERVSILMDLFKTKTWVHVSFGEEQGKDVYVRLKVKMGDLSLSFRIDFPPNREAHFNIEGGNIVMFYGPHHDYNLRRTIKSREDIGVVQRALRANLRP